MKNNIYAALAAFTLASALVACGGGGGGGSGSTPPTSSGNGGGSAPTPGASSSPASITGTLTVGNTGAALASGSTITVTCGCTGEAGQSTVGANGSYNLASSLTAIPASPAPYGLVPGRNYLIVGYQTGSGLQAWTMEFLGNTPATNMNLSGTPTNSTANTSDTAATAASLYIYREASLIQQNNTDQTFDLFNFNTIAAWANHLRTGTTLTSNETKFLSDVTAAQSSQTSLFPGSALPAWDPSQTQYGLNSTITSDITAIASDGVTLDSTLPTPCPGGAGSCTGTPTP